MMETITVIKEVKFTGLNHDFMLNFNYHKANIFKNAGHEKTWQKYG